MKGYWHFTAISVAMGILTIIFNSNWFIVGFFLWLFYLYYLKRLGKTPILLSLAFYLLFLLHVAPPADIDNTDPNSFSPLNQLTGKVISPIHTSPDKVEFLFEENPDKSKILILFFPDKKTQSPPLDENPTIKYGATCVINGKAELPNESRNPGQFDYRNYLLLEGITHQLIVNSLDDITCSGSGFLHRIYKIRTNLITHVEKSISKGTAAWLNALVLGDDSLIEDDTVELFQRWSLSHILAISGLHVGLVVGLIYFLLIKLNLLTKERAQWIMIFFLPIYAIISGGEPSVWRASTMVLIFIILNKLKLKFSVTDTLSIVFLLLIIFDNSIVYHVGFQLSFVVTFGLILSREWIFNSSSSFMRVLQISFVSQMMILPLQIGYFSTFQPLSVLLNLLIVPYFSLFVIPFMFLLLILPLPSFILGLFDRVFLTIQNYVIAFIECIDRIANFPWIIGAFPIGFAVIYYILFFVFMKKVQNNQLNNALKYGCIITILISSLAVRPYLSPIGTITMLDIGQGDAFVVELPYRKGVILVDAGATFSFEDMEPTDKVYKQIIKPFLYSKGINKIDAVFLSHEDMDHIGSVPFIVKDMKVDEIIISNQYEISEEAELRWKKNNVTVHQVKQDEKVQIGGQDFYVLSPSGNNNSPNGNSLVLYTELGGKSWLFTGDIGVAEEKEIIKTYQDLSVDVLKVAHHGSNTSTDKAFIKQLKPTFALISVGDKNRYGHPTMEVLETLTDEEVLLLRTDMDGAVQYRFKRGQGTFFKYLP